MHYLIPARHEHLEQIAVQLANTGYWRLGLEGNLPQLDYVSFMIKYIITPQLHFTTVLVEKRKEEIVHGVLICSSLKELEKLPDYSQYLHPTIGTTFNAVKEIQFPEGYVISFLTLDKALRGQKFGKKLFQFAENKAKEEGFENISLLVWSFSTQAIKFYHSMGMIVTQCITCEPPIDLPILCLQKNPLIVSMNNYLESSKYEQLHLVKNEIRISPMD